MFKATKWINHKHLSNKIYNYTCITLIHTIKLNIKQRNDLVYLRRSTSKVVEIIISTFRNWKTFSKGWFFFGITFTPGCMDAIKIRWSDQIIFVRFVRLVMTG